MVIFGGAGDLQQFFLDSEALKIGVQCLVNATSSRASSSVNCL
jgi:hypothetical protein